MSSIPTPCLNSDRSSKLPWWWIVAALYCLSGTTSLAYEVLWARMLSMQFGVSIFGVVLTVAAFMIGLGLGSLSGARWSKKCRAPLVWFAILEAGIALYALLLPVLQHGVSSWIENIAANLSLAQWYALQGAEALVLLVTPAFAMGVGFALILQVIQRTPLSLGKLYGLNTLGGVAGALLPLLSLPTVGWSSSVSAVAVLGLLVGAAAWILAHFVQPDDSLIHAEKNESVQRPPLSALLIYAGIGAGSIMLEIGWIRLYGMIMLRTEYVLGVILAIFLLGIALGSLVSQRMRHRGWMIALPAVAGSGVLLSVWLLPTASSWVEHSSAQSFFGVVYMQALVLAMFTLPVTLVLGAWLPLLSKRLGNSSGVWLYGVNCIGGGVGAILACVVLIPLMGSTAMVASTGVLIAVLGLLWVESHWIWLLGIALLPAAWSLRNMPPVHELLPKVEAQSRDLSLYEDAVSLTHVVQQEDGQRVLLSDLQRMDASSDPAAVEIQKDQARLALLLHHDPHSVLFLGLGTGISMSGSLPFDGLQRSAVELSQGAILAAQNWFSPVNTGVMQNVQVERDDARHFLSATRQKFDVIVGDLFHPDLAGMGSLLSVQQFQRAKNHLNADGLFVQWVALNQFDIESLKVVLRSFQRVFPEGQMFMDGMHLALVGTKSGATDARAMLANLQRLSASSQIAATGGEGAWTWLGRYWGPVTASVGPVQDEWLPYIEYSLPRARYDGNVNLAKLLGWMLKNHSDGGNAMLAMGVVAEDRSRFGRAYVASELMTRAWVDTLQGNEAQAGKLIWLAYQANPQDRWIANALADNMLRSLSQAGQHGFTEREALHKILKVYPDHVGALRALWHLEQAAGHRQEADSYRVRLMTLTPLDKELNAAS